MKKETDRLSNRLTKSAVLVSGLGLGLFMGVMGTLYGPGVVKTLCAPDTAREYLEEEYGRVEFTRVFFNKRASFILGQYLDHNGVISNENLFANFLWLYIEQGRINYDQFPDDPDEALKQSDYVKQLKRLHRVSHTVYAGDEFYKSLIITTLVNKVRDMLELKDQRVQFFVQISAQVDLYNHTLRDVLSRSDDDPFFDFFDQVHDQDEILDDYELCRVTYPESDTNFCEVSKNSPSLLAYQVRTKPGGKKVLAEMVRLFDQASEDLREKAQDLK
ncbi:hypothetical protein ACFLZY_02905 [Patescibacteria group bacterium]